MLVILKGQQVRVLDLFVVSPIKFKEIKPSVRPQCLIRGKGLFQLKRGKEKVKK